MVKKVTAKKTVAKKANTKPKQKEVETTEHEWDGIKEYNNPLPRWWLLTFYACIIYAIGYAIYYPSIPNVKSLSGWTQRGQLVEDQQKAEKAQKVFNDKIHAMTAQQIIDDDSIRNYAIEGGKAAFALNCSQCHGSGAGGAKGFPSLLDDEWLWGGKLEDILTTIKHGIRSPLDEDTRIGNMLAFGDDEMLEKDEIKNVIQYVMVQSKQIKPTEGSEEGATIFAENCAACHGEQGQGMHETGAPNLFNAIWLYGGDKSTLAETLAHGRKGEMPAFAKRLDEDTIKKLAVYVYSLSGGEK